MAPGDSIIVGDQLAAIDGRNAIEMKVEDICALISREENTPQSIELTFLRYTGPLSSLDGLIDEGHEIADSSLDGDRGRTRSQQTASSDEHVFDQSPCNAGPATHKNSVT